MFSANTTVDRSFGLHQTTRGKRLAIKTAMKQAMQRIAMAIKLRLEESKILNPSRVAVRQAP